MDGEKAQGLNVSNAEVTFASKNTSYIIGNYLYYTWFIINNSFVNCLIPFWFSLPFLPLASKPIFFLLYIKAVSWMAVFIYGCSFICTIFFFFTWYVYATLDSFNPLQIPVSSTNLPERFSSWPHHSHNFDFYMPETYTSLNPLTSRH